MPIRIDNSTVSDRAWGEVDKAALARRLVETPKRIAKLTAMMALEEPARTEALAMAAGVCRRGPASLPFPCGCRAK
jgi:hypothetical protein